MSVQDTQSCPGDSATVLEGRLLAPTPAWSLTVPVSICSESLSFCSVFWETSFTPFSSSDFFSRNLLPFYGCNTTCSESS